MVTAKDLAKAANEPYNTIDFWTGEDLLVYTRKGRKRFYPLEVNLERCSRIRELQNEGYSLPSIRKEFSRKGGI
ncbi:MAG: MerR family transcriptional regulator [Blastocatellia bacterium]